MNNPHRQPNNQEDPFLDPIREFFNGLPPITRTWFSASLVITALNTFDVIPEHQLIFIWDRIQSPYLEIWRIVTSFSWAGPGTLTDFPVLILLYSMAVSVPSYEMDPQEAGWISHGQVRRGQRRKHVQSDGIFAFLCCSFLILASYLLLTETNLLSPILLPFGLDRSLLQPLFTRTLQYSILTLDSFRHPNRQVNINFFPVQGRYVPLFHLAFGILIGYRVNEIIHGALIAFLYLYLIQENSFIASLIGRKRLIYTPLWIIHLVGEELYDDHIQVDPRPVINMTDGVNTLHTAAALNDLSAFHRQLEQLDTRLHGANSAEEIAIASALFRKEVGRNFPLSVHLIIISCALLHSLLKDHNGWQPLHEAARGGHVRIIRLLLELDDIERESNQQNNNNNGRIARHGSNRLKVNVNARTNNGHGCTALWLAEKDHGVDSDISRLLRDNGGLSIGDDDGLEGEEDRD